MMKIARNIPKSAKCLPKLANRKLACLVSYNFVKYSKWLKWLICLRSRILMKGSISHSGATAQNRFTCNISQTNLCSADAFCASVARGVGGREKVSVVYNAAKRLYKICIIFWEISPYKFILTLPLLSCQIFSGSGSGSYLEISRFNVEPPKNYAIF